MSIDTTRYADNVYYKHLERFRDTCLERKLNAHCRIIDLFNAYDVFCEQNNIVHRKIVTHELLPELSRIGVRLGRVRMQKAAKTSGRVYVEVRPAFVTWRLTRNAKYAIRDRPRLEQDYILVPMGRRMGRDDDDDSM